MSRLSKLVARPENIVVGGEELTIYPLSVEDLDLVMDLDDDAKRTSAMKTIITKTIQRAVPDATAEEISRISLAHFKEITTAILKVNNLSQDDKKQDSGTAR